MKKLIIFLTIIILLILSTVSYIYWNAERHKFTVDKWKDNTDERGRIVTDFLKKYNIYSMNKKSIYSLLGEPMPKSDYPSRLIVIFKPENNKIPSEEWELNSENTVIYPLVSNINVYEGSALYIKFDKNQHPIYYALIYFST